MDSKMYTHESKQRMCNQILKRMRGVANQYKDDIQVAYRNTIKEIKFTREIEKLIEYVIYNAVETGEQDINRVSKNINKTIEKTEINLVDYFTILFMKDNLLLMKTFLETQYDDLETSLNSMLVHLAMEYINIVKFREDKRVITGVDVANNRIKYSTEEIYFDNYVSSVRPASELDAINRCKTDVLNQYTRCMEEANNADFLFSSVYDRLDDSLRTFRRTVIMVDILEQLSGVKFSKPNKDMCEQVLKLNIAIRNEPDILENRHRLTDSKGTLIRKADISCLFKEVAVGDYVFIVAEYQAKTDGRVTIPSNTIIIPISEEVVIQDTSLEVLHMIYDYYSDNQNGVSVLPVESWKYRKSNYEGHEEDRKYFEIEIETFIRKANTASEHAKQLAKKYHLNLPEGYTLVDKFTRRYNKDLIEQ